MKQQKVSVSLCKKPVYVNADAIRIEQILINLINNASRYTQERGKITVRCTAKNGTVQISIKDNGSGMSRKKISRIFDLFQSGGQSFMGVGGLGIGLNIVKHLTLMHQGTIKAKSKGANKGSEFIVELPKVKDKTIVLSIPSQQQPQTIKIPQKKNSKILIVDDNKDISRIMQRILKGQGYEVKEADKGLAAVKIAKTFNPDIALIDIGLPDISGYKVAEMITEHGQTAANWTKPKMIAVTGYGQPKDKLMAKKAGFDNHLTKPIDLNNLMRLLS